jgi:hypothetical protein
VNTTTFGVQADPDVASDAAGNFVVVWRDGDPPTTIRAQRFSAAGFPIGGEFQVNTYTRGSQGNPSVASAPDGRFVVTWYGRGDLYAQRFDASGAPQGPEFRVNSPRKVSFGSPTSVATDRNGNFVVAWEGRSQMLASSTSSAGGSTRAGPHRVRSSA